MIDQIILAGDSYSAELKSGDCYGSVLANKVGAKIKNLAVPGSNNDRIFRSLQETILAEHSNCARNFLVIIGLTFIRRTEIWYHGEMDHSIWNRLPDKGDLEQHEVLPVCTLDWVLDRAHIKQKYQHLITEDFFIHKKLLDFYLSLYGLVRSLEVFKIPFFIFSAARNTDCPTHCFPAIDRLQTVKYIKQHPGIFDLHEFCILDWAEKNDPDSDPVTGHLSPDGHTKFADFLCTKMNEKGILK